MRKFCMRTLAMFSVAICCAIGGIETCRADSAAQVIYHHTPTGTEIPNPGAVMTLKFEVTDSRDLERPVRLMLVRDGRMIEIPLSQSYLDERDHPTFEFQVNAPIADIYYQLYVYDKKGGNPIVSSPYGFRRPCLPQIDLVDAKLDPKLAPIDQVRNSYAQSQVLGQEVEEYQKALHTLQDLQELLKD